MVRPLLLATFVLSLCLMTTYCHAGEPRRTAGPEVKSVPRETVKRTPGPMIRPAIEIRIIPPEGHGPMVKPLFAASNGRVTGGFQIRF